MYKCGFGSIGYISFVKGVIQVYVIARFHDRFVPSRFCPKYPFQDLSSTSSTSRSNDWNIIDRWQSLQPSNLKNCVASLVWNLFATFFEFILKLIIDRQQFAFYLVVTSTTPEKLTHFKLFQITQLKLLEFLKFEILFKHQSSIVIE